MAKEQGKPNYALVTGATSGIGEAVLKALLKANYKVFAVSKTQSKLDSLERKFKEDLEVLRCDFTKISEIKALVRQIKDLNTNLNLMVNVAGLYHSDTRAFCSTNFQDYSQNEVMDTLQVGLLAPVLLAHSLVEMMPAGSNILNISGTFETAKGWLPYYLSKKGLENLTMGLSQELSDRGIRVNCISPADTLTPAYKKFFPEYASKEQCLMPEEVASTLMQVVENETINGQIIEIRRYRNP